MRVVAAPAEDGSTRQAELHLLVAREERPGEKEGRADLPSEGAWHVHGLELARDADGAFIELFDLRPERTDDLEHAAHVADARDVVQRDWFVGQETRCDERKGLVLIPGRGYLATQRRPAFNNESRHPAR